MPIPSGGQTLPHIESHHVSTVGPLSMLFGIGSLQNKAYQAGKKNPCKLPPFRSKLQSFTYYHAWFCFVWHRSTHCRKLPIVKFHQFLLTRNVLLTLPNLDLFYLSPTTVNRPPYIAHFAAYSRLGLDRCCSAGELSYHSLSDGTATVGLAV